MESGQQESAARNEALFREINERISEITDSQRERTAEIFCECSVTSCNELIQVSLAEYEAVRARGNRFAVIAGHEEPAVERVVERNERFALVEKIGRGADVAEELNPRSSPPG